MHDECETKGRRVEVSTKTGLEILYAKPEDEFHLTDDANQAVPGDLRERFWIRMAEDAGIGGKLWSSGISAPLWIERHELGRGFTDPGDGFRYVYRRGNDGTGSRAEWFEVTEVIESEDRAKNIEIFMRINNGGKAGVDFDPDMFLSGLTMGIPCRSAQRIAADQVIAAVEKKMNKASYKGMWQCHGYGTLIVGLPLWFATIPKNPLRVENVIDDFFTRVSTGLIPYKRKLKKKNCPFWRIVVVWMPSLESVREWCTKAKFDVYDDPIYRRIGTFPFKFERMATLLPKMLGALEAARSEGVKAGVFKLYISTMSPKKQENAKTLQLPPKVAALKQALDGDEEGRDRENQLAHVKSRVREWVLNVRCFVWTFGLQGFEHWVIARMSPRHLVFKLAMKSRAIRLYRASLR